MRIFSKLIVGFVFDMSWGLMEFGVLFICWLIYFICKLIVLEQQMPTFDSKTVPLQAEVSR